MKIIVSEENYRDAIDSINSFLSKNQTVSIFPFSKKQYRFIPFIGSAREHWHKKEDPNCVIAIGDKYEHCVTPVHIGDAFIFTKDTFSFIPSHKDREFSRPKTWIHNRYSSEDRRNHIRDNLLTLIWDYDYDSFDSDDHIHEVAKSIYREMSHQLEMMIRHRDTCLIEDNLYGNFYNEQIKIQVCVDISSFGEEEEEEAKIEDIIYFRYIPESNAPKDFTTGKIESYSLPFMLVSILRRDFIKERKEENEDYYEYDPFEGDFSTLDDEEY